MSNTSKSTLVFIFNHHNLVTENFGKSICAALHLFGMNAHLISINQDLVPQLSGINLNEVELIISIGSPTVSIKIDGVPIYNFFKCPFYLYLIDPPIYDLARYPATGIYFRDSFKDSRLKVGFAEKSYMNLFEKFAFESNISPNLNFLPFASFPNNAIQPPLIKKQKRILVVGSIGSELQVEGVRKAENLKELIYLNNPYGMNDSSIDLLVDALNNDKFLGNVTKLIIEIWGLDLAELFDPNFLKFACAIDAFIKFNSRISIVSSSIGLGVDFYGPGWRDRFGNVPNFNFYPDIKHNQISETSSKYHVLLNFDPNWEYGTHDRVFTGISAGASVITNKNLYLDEVVFNGAYIHQYLINNPKIREFGEMVFDKEPNTKSNIQSFTSKHNWFERISTLLGSL